MAPLHCARHGRSWPDTSPPRRWWSARASSHRSRAARSRHARPVSKASYGNRYMSSATGCARTRLPQIRWCRCLLGEPAARHSREFRTRTRAAHIASDACAAGRACPSLFGRRGKFATIPAIHQRRQRRSARLALGQEGGCSQCAGESPRRTGGNGRHHGRGRRRQRSAGQRLPGAGSAILAQPLDVPRPVARGGGQQHLLL